MAELNGLLDLIQAISGSIGATISTAIVFPLDRFKARLQCGETLPELLSEIQTGGLSNLPNLWQGARSRILESAASKFSYFYFYSLLTVYMENRNNNRKLSTAMNLVVGFVAAVFNNALTLPLQVTSTRIMVSQNKNSNFWKEGQLIVQTEGFSGLWRGYVPSMILCINPAISFASFDQVKLFLLKSRGLNLNTATLSTYEAFLIGAAAKAIATLVTFPFIRVKTLMQVGKNKVKKKNKSDQDIEQKDPAKKKVMNVLKELYYNDGIVGLYTGLTPQLIKGVAASAILFAAKENIFVFTKQIVVNILDQNT